jgi:glycerol-3-phosphate dehydrogenase (NAD(P)+)
MKMKKRKKNKILIVGNGELGTALGKILSQNEENQVTVWGEEPNLPPAEVVFMAVPTIAVEDVIFKIKSTQSKDCIVVVLSKGLGRNGETPWELADKNWDGPVVLISGPMIAEELMPGKSGSALIAGSKDDFVQKVISLFRASNFHLSVTKDLTGLSWVGPLKNLYAIGLGVAEGQGKGLNYKGRYVCRAVEEMTEIVSHFGGQKQTAYTISGLGDLITTGLSPHSSNFQLGVSLANKNKPEKISEGVEVAKGLELRLENTIRQFPLACDIIQNITHIG